MFCHTVHAGIQLFDERLSGASERPQTRVTQACSSLTRGCLGHWNVPRHGSHRQTAVWWEVVWGIGASPDTGHTGIQLFDERLSGAPGRHQTRVTQAYSCLMRGCLGHRSVTRHGSHRHTAVWWEVVWGTGASADTGHTGIQLFDERLSGAPGRH